MIAGLALVLAVNLSVLCAGAALEMVHQLAERYTQATGNAVAIVSGTAGELRARLDAGERADVVILPAAGFDDLERTGRLAAGTRTDLGRTGMGVGVRSGSHRSPISRRSTGCGARCSTPGRSLRRTPRPAQRPGSTSRRCWRSWGLPMR